jgi:hypothetical protein
VYRSATAPFTPAANLIASGPTGAPIDHAGLANGASYKSIVRAFDAANHADDGNVVSASAPTARSPTAPGPTTAAICRRRS